MNRIEKMFSALAILIAMAAIAGCERQEKTVVVHDTVLVRTPDTVALGTDSSGNDALSSLPVTLPLLDAFFGDSTFAGDLKQRLGLTDAQIDSLRIIARIETSKLNESYSGEYSGTTDSARRLAEERISGVIGPEKMGQLAGLIRERWSGGDTTGLAGSGFIGDSGTARRPNFVPSDTRIVVNPPAYRMDLFRNGELIRSYKIGIGYPEFPIPTGMRAAREIVFNPTWTPPDESWVEAPNSKVKPGQKVPAGSKLNPLGIAKVPIGLPSLIHGGKSAGQLGGFASHGCVGLTNEQMREFSLLLAEMGNTTLVDSTVKGYGKRKDQTETVSLGTPIPVELRYETMMVLDGELHLYRDVYDHNTNTEENLRALLAVYGVTLEQLTPAERQQVTEALRAMSRNATGSDSVLAGGDTATSKTKGAQGKLTRTMKGKKEMVVPIAALKGKGYPVMVDRVATDRKTGTPSRGTTL